MTTTDHTLTPSTPMACEPTPPSRVMVFIDGMVDDWPVLVAGLQGSPQVVILDPGLNGVEQMSAALATCRDLTAIHIISHGSPGALRLGSTKLSWLTLPAHGKAIQDWRSALQPGAEILIYGCEVAAGLEGEAFLQRLHELTGANLAASTTKTGAADLGGDWALEHQLGAIATDIVVSAQVQEGYRYVLGIISDTSGNDTLFGTATTDSIMGGSGDDRLFGGLGDDTLSGGAGEDFLYGGGGDDLFTYGDISEINGLLEGIDGGAGNDTIRVNSSNDTYDFTQTTITNIEQLKLNSTVSVKLSADQIAGIGAFTGTLGSSNILTVVGAVNFTNKVLTNISGINGTSDNESIIGSAGADTIRGLAGDDTLNGGLGDDSLVGGEGTDTLLGGAGDDTFSYSASSEIDALAERIDGGPGTDVLKLSGNSSNTFDCTRATITNIEQLKLENSALVKLTPGQINGIDAFTGTLGSNNAITVVGTGAADFTNKTLTNIAAIYGSAGNEIIVGSANGDKIWGRNGDDKLSGGLGNDTLSGEAGADRLDGGAGADSLTGGTGNDWYAVDQAGDSVIELSGEGTDTVQSSMDNYTLGSNVENLTLAGTAVTGTGNTMANILTGNGEANTLSGLEGNDRLLGNGGNDTLNGGAGSDILNGGLGSDSMVGGQGNDTYWVDEAGDSVVEQIGEGIDTVRSSVTLTLASNVENLILVGSAASNGTGNDLINVISGNAGANVLTGGGGTDILTGGGGRDAFKFVTVGEGGDLVNDFVHGQDSIQVVGANFGGLAAGVLAAGQLLAAGVTPTTSNPVFLFNATSSELSFDADGNGGGAAVRLVTLLGCTDLTAGDIKIVAA